MFTVVISTDFKVSVVSCVLASVHMSFIKEKMRSMGKKAQCSKAVNGYQKRPNKQCNWLCGLSSVPPRTSGAKPGHLGVPKTTFGIPGQNVPNRDCPGKTGTVGQLDYAGLDKCMGNGKNNFSEKVEGEELLCQCATTRNCTTFAALNLHPSPQPNTAICSDPQQIKSKKFVTIDIWRIAVKRRSHQRNSTHACSTMPKLTTTICATNHALKTTTRLWVATKAEEIWTLNIYLLTLHSKHQRIFNFQSSNNTTDKGTDKANTFYRIITRSSYNVRSTRTVRIKRSSVTQKHPVQWTLYLYTTQPKISSNSQSDY